MAADDDDSGVAVAIQVALQLLGAEAGEDSNMLLPKSELNRYQGRLHNY